MKLTEIFLGDLEREAPGTRKVLERVPEGKADWKPHPKSMPLGYLSVLVATMPGWVDLIVNRDEFDFAPVSGGTRPPDARNTSELLRLFEESLDKARAALTNTTDEHLMTNWRLLARGNLITELPRHVNIRDAVINHLAHHRGQLTVYLRLNDALVPAVYGPSADERI